jgi:hypothetical protein
MSPKIPSILNIPANMPSSDLLDPDLPPESPKGASGATAATDLAAKWAEARLAYPLYEALANLFKFPALPYAAGTLPPAKAPADVVERDLQWFAEIDEKVRAYQIRQIPSETLNAKEESLGAFILRQLKKPDKTTVDRDKIDLLLVQYFALCAPEELYRSQIRLEDVAKVLRPVLPLADAEPLEWCKPLDEILSTADHCESMRDLMEAGLFEKGRMLKDSAGCMFYDPAALVAFCRFNFLLRRAFIRLLHADLSAVGHAVDALESAGVKSVDCRRAGLSAAETTVQLRFFYENWRQPFQKDYTESSVTRAFEQLLALRADLEEAVSKTKANGAPSAPAATASPATKGPEAPPATAKAVVPSAKEKEAAAPMAAPAAPAKPELMGNSEPAPPASEAKGSATALTKAGKPAADSAAAHTGPLNAEKCLEQIWEQLIAVPPSRGRSMSTVVLQDTKVLLSSWEVSAFVTEGGQEAEDLRRAVVARALLSVAMDQRKRSGEESALSSALSLARSEASYFQGRVETAKRAKNTEAAVNLGISTKRLLSVVEEAEKL